jgi:hypothetical protein
MADAPAPIAFTHPCGLCRGEAVVPALNAYTPRIDKGSGSLSAIAALFGRFLPRLGPTAFAGRPFFCPVLYPQQEQ